MILKDLYLFLLPLINKNKIQPCKEHGAISPAWYESLNRKNVRKKNTPHLTFWPVSALQNTSMKYILQEGIHRYLGSKCEKAPWLIAVFIQQIFQVHAPLQEYLKIKILILLIFSKLLSLSRDL